MDRPKKIVSQQKTEAVEKTLNQQQVVQAGAHEFGSVEEMLRHDAIHTPVPPAIGQRLEKSTTELPAPARSWWRRLLGGKA